MKIYTRTGDLGTTSLVGGKRVAKCSPRLEAYGTIDELNSFIGLLAAGPDLTAAMQKTLHMVQNKLFNVGAYLATDNTDTPDMEPTGMGHETIATLEADIDKLTEQLPEQRTFILPGGTISAAQAQVCRAVCRRAERCVLRLNTEAAVSPLVLRFLNRLSDYLFTLGRALNHLSGVADIPWQQ